MVRDFRTLEGFDSELTDLLRSEEGRQKGNVELIASENFVSDRVLEAMGSVLTNKYAEGYPAKRYYGGCEYVDGVEDLARNRAKELFNAEHANVQPHSGAQANMAVYFAALEPGDTVLGMDLSHGGHLTHGSPVNYSGKWFSIISYGVNKESERIEYEEVARLAKEHKPKMIIAGASAYPREIDFAKFREIADSVGAKLLVDMAHIAGLVAAGLHPSPIPYAHYSTSTTHKTLRGPRGGLILTDKEHAKEVDKAVFPGIQGGPLMHVIAAKAVAFKEALEPDFVSYQKKVVQNAQVLAESLMGHGLRLVSGGTDNHLMLVDLSNEGISGKEAEKLLDQVGITVNKNTIPFDQAGPFVTSGIRIGTPAITTRGMGIDEMRILGELIAQTIRSQGNETLLKDIKDRVWQLANSFPYPQA